MKKLILMLSIFASSSLCYAEYISNKMSDEQVAEIANSRSYPGGMDEDELLVQKEALEAKQHVTAATLQWRAERTLSRGTAASEKQDSE